MQSTQRRSYTETKNHYETIRRQTRDAAQQSLSAILPNKFGSAILREHITFRGITFDCERALRKWEKSGLRRVAWDWDLVQKQYRAQPKRFELTIWHKTSELCGASIGKPTAQGGKLRVDFLESAPMGTPLDGLITELTIRAGVAYAGAIGATQIRIMNPVNEAVKNHYLSKPGFSYDQPGNYCYREVI